MPFKLITREDWEAQPRSEKFPELEIPIKYVIMTKTGTKPCTTDSDCRAEMRKLQAYHIGLGEGDMPYSFVITPDANVYEGRGWTQVVPTPSERPELKDKTLVIAHIGDYPDYAEESIKMLDMEEEVIEHYVKKNYISKKFRLFRMDDDEEVPSGEEGNDT